MQAVAAWLIARPLNSAVALAATIPLRGLSFLSGVILVMLVLYKGPKLALRDVAIAFGFVGVLAVVLQVPLVNVFVWAITIWLPAMLLAIVMLWTRSLTLTLQLTVILTVVAIVLFYIAVGDAVGFWRPLIESVVAAMREQDGAEAADIVSANLDAFAASVTLIAALSLWLVYSVNGVLGYLLYRQIPEELPSYGELRDMSIGRVMAIGTLVAFVMYQVTGWLWVRDIAVILAFAFFLQGLGVLHWSHHKGRLSEVGLIGAYFLMIVPFLNIAVFFGLVLLGHSDAWFRLRRDQAEQSD